MFFMVLGENRKTQKKVLWGEGKGLGVFWMEDKFKNIATTLGQKTIE